MQPLASQDDCSWSQSAVMSDPAPHLYGIHRKQHRKQHPSCFNVRDLSVRAEIPDSVEGEAGLGSHAYFGAHILWRGMMASTTVQADAQRPSTTTFWLEAPSS